MRIVLARFSGVSEMPTTMRASVRVQIAVGLCISWTFAGVRAAVDGLGASERDVPDSVRTVRTEPSIGDVPVSEEGNSEAWTELRRAIHERYSYRDRVVEDWDAVFAPLQDAAVKSQSADAFAAVAIGALSTAQDPHLWLWVGDRKIETFERRFISNVDEALLRASIPPITDQVGSVAATVLRRPESADVGYVSITDWPRDEALVQPALDFVSGLSARGIDRLIVDVRKNGGGSELTAKKFASVFVHSRTVYARHRYRDPRAIDGWGRMRERVIDSIADDGGGTRRFDGRVVVLQGGGCLSANESFLLMMRHGARATLVGGVSGGSSGNPKPIELGNGVILFVPSWDNRYSDNSSFEGRGIAPDVVVDWPPVEGATVDPVLAAALERIDREP